MGDRELVMLAVCVSLPLRVRVGLWVLLGVTMPDAD